MEIILYIYTTTKYKINKQYPFKLHFQNKFNNLRKTNLSRFRICYGLGIENIAKILFFSENYIYIYI